MRPLTVAAIWTLAAAVALGGLIYTTSNNTQKPKKKLTHAEVIDVVNPNGRYAAFVIGQVHRHPVDGSIVKTEIDTQVQVYRTAEQFHTGAGIELFLGEGLTGLDNGMLTIYQPHELTEMLKGELGPNFDIVKKGASDKTLERILGNYKGDEVYGLTLMQVRYPIELQGGEDRRIHKLHLDLVRQGSPDAKLVRPYRDWTVLQAAPEMIDYLIKEGRIKSRDIAIAVGISHLPNIDRVLTAGRIQLPGLPKYNLPKVDEPIRLLKTHAVYIVRPNALRSAISVR